MAFNPQPKPAPRPKKVPKPLRRTPPSNSRSPQGMGHKPQGRTAPLKRMIHDPASFRTEDLIAVYGPSKVCIQTALTANAAFPVDDHHIMGRGELFGFRPNHAYRPVFSSVFNRAGLGRIIHHGPLRDADDQRRVYLRVAADHVLNAIGRGTYSPRPEDHAFLEWLRSKGYDAPTLPE